MTQDTPDLTRRALPEARFDSATDRLVRIKLLRGNEELALLEKVS